MHEFSIGRSVAASRSGGGRDPGRTARRALVCAHWAPAGQVLPEALTFAFDALATGTLAQGATLIWDEIPPRVRCHACQAIFQPEEDWFWTCPRCGVTGGEVLEGDELVLQSVTVKMQ